MEVESCAITGDLLSPTLPTAQTERLSAGARVPDSAIPGKVFAILCVIVYAGLTAALRDADNGWPKLWGYPPSEVDIHEQLLAPMIAVVPPQAHVRYVAAKHKQPENLTGRRLGLTRYALVPRLVRTKGPAEWLLVDGNPEDKQLDPPPGESWTFVMDLGDGLHLFRHQP
jgi:hypothetical protein